jgi:metal-responsive CopG/Arc/MetJ family transcriptional regulator
MKTAVSIPDPVFQAADRMAARLRLSRSELYARALRRYLESDGDAEVTARLDAVYADVPSVLDPVLTELQRRSIDEAW